MITPTQRRQPYCKYCGSIEVRLDAFAAWDTKLQEWVLSDVYDQEWCSQCEGETSIGWSDLDESAA